MARHAQSARRDTPGGSRSNRFRKHPSGQNRNDQLQSSKNKSKPKESDELERMKVSLLDVLANYKSSSDSSSSEASSSESASESGSESASKSASELASESSKISEDVIPSDIWCTSNGTRTKIGPDEKFSQGYPSLTPYGECFETTPRGILINDTNNVGCGDWSLLIEETKTHMRPSVLKSFGVTALDGIAAKRMLSSNNQSSNSWSYLPDQGGRISLDNEDTTSSKPPPSMSEMC